MEHDFIDSYLTCQSIKWSAEIGSSSLLRR
jgi:hypothetical protein